MQNETQKNSIKQEVRETIALGLPMTASYLIYATSILIQIFNVFIPQKN